MAQEETDATDYTSILRLIETRFKMPAITKRDANAEPPLDMFDFGHADTRTR